MTLFGYGDETLSDGKLIMTRRLVALTTVGERPLTEVPITSMDVPVDRNLAQKVEGRETHGLRFVVLRLL
jgi:hypothetical protein